MSDIRRASIGRTLHSAAHICFIAFLSLTLLTYSGEWDQGPFAWGALRLPGLPLHIGVLSFLPAVAAVSGAMAWRLTGRRPTWGLGRRGLGRPMLALTIWALLNLGQASQPALVVVMLGLWGGVMLFLLNEEPALVWPLALTAALQAAVGVGQFVSQHSLGLTWLGEPMLDPQQAGVSVVMNAGERWLRAYGINSHPNRLGLKLTLLLMMLLGLRPRVAGRARAWLDALCLIGGMGLLVSLSRSAWLGLGVGLTVLAYPHLAVWRTERAGFRTIRPIWWQTSGPVVMVGLLFLSVYGGVVFGRFFALDHPLEQRSLTERARDLPIALELLRAHPWAGVGVGQSVAAAQALNPQAGLVHNVPLLIGAELGWPGLLLWLWLLITPLARPGAWSAHLPRTALWLALVVIGLLQPELSPFTLQGAVLLGLVCGVVGRT